MLVIISYYCISDDFVDGFKSIILKFVMYKYEYIHSHVHTSIYRLKDTYSIEYEIMREM